MSAIRTINNAKVIASTLPNNLTLGQALAVLNYADPFTSEFWQAVSYAKAVLQALSGEPVDHDYDST